MTGTTRSSDGLDDRRKRLLFRCWHRGTREMDLIIGRFADAHLTELSDAELTELEQLIELPDPDLYAALIGARRHSADTGRGRIRADEEFSRLGSRPMSGPRSMKSPAELLRPGSALTISSVADGAEGLITADLAPRDRGQAEGRSRSVLRSSAVTGRAWRSWCGRWSSSHPRSNCCSFPPGIASPMTACRRTAEFSRSG